MHEAHCYLDASIDESGFCNVHFLIRPIIMSILRRLNVRLPIVQAPMTGTSTPEMAAAVSNAGALGSIGLGSSNVEASRKAIQRVQQLTDKAFNVNFFVHRPARIDPETSQAWINHLRPTFESFGAEVPTDLKDIYRSFAGHQEMLDVLLETKPPVVSFHFGLPSQSFIDQLKSSGAVLFASVTCLEEARRAEYAGIDCLVVSPLLTRLTPGSRVRSWRT